MKTLQYYVDMYESYIPPAREEIHTTWESRLSPQLQDILLTDYNKMVYFELTGYLLYSIADLFGRNIAPEQALDGSNLWYGIRLIDEAVDNGLVTSPNTFLDDCFAVLNQDDLQYDHTPLEYDVLSALSILNVQNPSLRTALSELKDSVKKERSITTPTEFFEVSKDVGIFSGDVYYHLLSEENPLLRSFCQGYGFAGNMMDNFRNVTDDDHDFGFHTPLAVRLKTLEACLLETYKLMKFPVSTHDMIQSLRVPFIYRKKIKK
jgi:hypothetical protein